MKLSRLFSNHAVLQRELPIPVWGWCTPGARVRVTLAGQAGETFAADDGKFLVRLPPLQAGGPHVLTAVQIGGEQVESADIWIGEVWLASGQSNMGWTLANCAEAVTAEIPGIRMFSVPNAALPGRQSQANGEWSVATPEKAPGFSAVAFHFARRLHDELKIPVGILNSSWGGTRIEAWHSREALVQNPAARADLLRYEATCYGSSGDSPLTINEGSDAAVFAAKLKGFKEDPGNKGFGLGWARLDFDDADWPTMQLPSTWQRHNLMFSGSLWFRREVVLPQKWAGKELRLRIGAVDKHDVTYFNGEQIGATGVDFEENFWNKPREYTVPARLVKSGKNVIAVRAFSFVYEGGLIGPADAMSVSPVDDSVSAIPLSGDWRYAIEHNFGKAYVPQPAPYGPGNPNTPAILFDNMIAPLLPYALRGTIWYQGESNAENAAHYRDLMTGLIRDWRHAWGQGDFPFLIVQLANYMLTSMHQPESKWARLRESQLQALNEPGAGMAVAIDVGEANDIHPRNKRDVGRRLAQWALHDTYGLAPVPSGPLYSGMTIEGDRIRIQFRHIGGGLVARGGVLKTFVIAGSDRTFAAADARVEGRSIVVSNPEIAAPVAVRYAWADNPDGCNLYNADGLPASPFRTDVW